MKLKSLVTTMAAALLSLGLVPAVNAQDADGGLPEGVQVFGRAPAFAAPARARGPGVEAHRPGGVGAAQRRGANADRLLGRIDSNDDGVIDEGEFIASRGGNVDEAFSRRDLDGDGLLSREELAPRPRPDRPGIDRQAVIACVREIIADFDPTPELHDRFDTMDTNDDGFVDQLELSTALQARAYALFDRIDTNDDGVLTLEEMEAAHAQTLNLRRVIRYCMDQVVDPFATEI